MDRQDYINNMRLFLESKTFLDRDVVDDGEAIRDRDDPGLVYIRRVSSLDEIPPEPDEPDDYDPDVRGIPAIYVSDSPSVARGLGGPKYDARSWSAERVNELQGFEYDYAYLHQCSVLGRRPSCRWWG